MFNEDSQEGLVLKNYYTRLRRLVIVDILEQLSNGGQQETVPYESVLETRFLISANYNTHPLRIFLALST